MNKAINTWDKSVTAVTICHWGKMLTPYGLNSHKRPLAIKTTSAWQFDSLVAYGRFDCTVDSLTENLLTRSYSPKHLWSFTKKVASYTFLSVHMEMSLSRPLMASTVPPLDQRVFCGKLVNRGFINVWFSQVAKTISPEVLYKINLSAKWSSQAQYQAK